MANNRLFHFFAPKHHHIFNSHRLIFYRSVGDSGSIPRQRHFVRSSFQSLFVWSNMGFCLLHRKFLHSTSNQIVCGFTFGFRRFTILLLSIQDWNISLHFSYVMETCTGMHLGKRRRRKRDIEMTDMSINGSDEETDMETSFSYRNNGRRRLSSRDHKRNHFRRSLRPKSHRLRVGVDGDSVYATKRKRIKHGDVQVVKTSSFARKGTNHKRSRRK
ncbi:unnamed protein product [Lactuca saligna]|uniref:Uncharacterized protein n=1 Tax=Lactuca saligna TaxID=75948 RepID=A0AA36EL94_LACSI|nr:unnamed protein product [Lactuca saligna]